jgi:hypothetical protein
LLQREELLTVDDVGEYLRVNPQTVRNWIDSQLGAAPRDAAGAHSAVGA